MGTEKPLNITVAGLWHLGCVTAACCARHFQVTGLDFDPHLIAALNRGQAPLHEPGLNELLDQGLRHRTLTFTDNPQRACAKTDVLWLTYDTPVDDRDTSDVQFVLDQLGRCLPCLPDGALVLVSSQLPVGTCRALEQTHPQLHFACSPENLRLGRAVAAFTQADRIVVGLRDNAKKELLQQLLSPFTDTILWMKTESAEMVKHGLNTFLALSITFINELARLCERTGADAREVARGLKSDPRIGPKAYLGPGGPFAGGTLARDVVTLTQLGGSFGEPLQVIPAIKHSNDQHRGWAAQRLQDRLGELSGKTIAILGLTYTPNTNTLRRSAAVELCRFLLNNGAQVRTFDPAVKSLPESLAEAVVAPNLAGALHQADAAVVCTEWPQFREASWKPLLADMRRPLILDANGFLENNLIHVAQVEHLCVGRNA